MNGNDGDSGDGGFRVRNVFGKAWTFSLSFYRLAKLRFVYTTIVWAICAYICWYSNYVHITVPVTDWSQLPVMIVIQQLRQLPGDLGLH